MSDSLQLGHHPDADQISAFVEHALPAHEREQLLSHLAVCPECRAVVALSLPEPELPSQPVAVPASKPWWRGWAVAVPLAAAILLVIYLHRTPGAPTAREPQLADVRPAQRLSEQTNAPLPTVPKEPAVPAQPAASVVSAPRQARSESLRTAQGQAVAAAPAPAPQAFASGEAIAGLSRGGPIVTGRNFASLRSQSDTPVGSAAPSTAATAAKEAPIATSSNGTELALKQTAASSLPAIQAPKASANETVSVQNSSLALDTASADLSTPVIAEQRIQAAPPGRPLPSHLPILSSATLGKRIVAIDTAHNVFASKDAGKHWKPLLTPWRGHPMQARLTQLPRGVARAGMANFAPAAMPPAPAPAPGTAPSILSGVVTDRSGAVIPGASVTASEIATGIGRTTRTDAAGHYLFTALSPGAYRLEAQAPGFQRQQLPSVAVQPASPATANLRLGISESSQTVTVTGGTDALDSEVAKKPRPRTQPAPLFQIVTDSGDRWTSPDGLHWNHH